MNRGLYILKCVLLGILAVLVVGLVTKLLWNWLIPSLFHGPTITYWQALGLLLLSKILFWGFSGKSHRHSHERAADWKRRFSEKFSNMTPEEREAFKQKMKNKWCSAPGKDAGASSDSEADSEKFQ